MIYIHSLFNYYVRRVYYRVLSTRLLIFRRCARNDGNVRYRSSRNRFDKIPREIASTQNPETVNLLEMAAAKLILVSSLASSDRKLWKRSSSRYIRGLHGDVGARVAKRRR